MNPAELNLNPIDQIHPVVVVAVMLIVVATYFALRKAYVFPYLHVLEEREQIFEKADAENAEATQCVSEASAACELMVAEAVAEAEAMRAEAHGRAEQYRRAQVTKATNAAAARLEEGRAQIAQARSAEVERLRSEAAECVQVACGQLVGEVDDDLVSATVDRLMARQVN